VKRIGIDLDGLGAGAGLPPPGPPPCPGASLRVDRAMLAEHRREGEFFVPGNDQVPYGELGTVRVSCRNDVDKLPKTSSGNAQYYGLCHSCSGLEVSNRQWLAKRVAAGAK
jgi:hypothetical protein